MGRLAAAMGVLALGCSMSDRPLMSALPPKDQACIIKITSAPEWVVSVERNATVEPCTWIILNGMPSPKHSCAWVILLSPETMYATDVVNGFGGGQCIEPLVQCISGNCP